MLPSWTRRACALSLLVFCWASPAAAECTKAYTGDELVQDLGTMTTSLRSLDEPAFRAAGARLEANLACVRAHVPPGVFATAYRFVGTYHFFAGREEDARRWFRSSLELDPTFDWDINEIDQGHPLRQVFAEERAVASTDPTPITGKVLNVPAGSALYLDGRRLARPEAALDRPHLVQVIATSDNTARQVFVIEGNAIPPQFLLDESMVAQPVEPAQGGRKGKKDKEPEKVLGEFEVIKVQRVRPKAKTPLMISGVVIMAGSGAIYAASFASHTEFTRADTSDELERYRTVTNSLVVAAGATFAVGASIEYAGVMLSGGPGFSIVGRF